MGVLLVSELSEFVTRRPERRLCGDAIGSSPDLPIEFYMSKNMAHGDVG